MLPLCTTRLIDLLGGRAVVLVDAPRGDDDWYANLLRLDRRNVRAAHARRNALPGLRGRHPRARRPAAGPFIAAHVEAARADEKLPTDLLGLLDSDAVRVARTVRPRTYGGWLSVLCPQSVPAEVDFLSAERRVARIPALAEAER